jgi:thioredoxin reductase (NADPH)
MELDVIIIGAGCAGLSAGIYCGRAEMKTKIFSGEFSDKGGLLVKTSIVENFPGFPDGIMGFDLVHNIELQAIKYGAEIVDRTVVSLEKRDQLFEVMDNKGEVYTSKAVIIATGSKPNKLHLPDEDRLWSKGISSCSVCDGACYKKKKIAVVGGGDSCLEQALFLTKFSNVTLIHRRDKFRASAVMQKRLFANPKISIIYDTEIVRLIGEEKMQKIEIRNVKTGETKELEVDGLFYGLGLTPNTSLFKDLVQMKDGYITQFDGTATSVPGIFSAGDCSDNKYRQAGTASAEGIKSALDAISYIEINFA